MSASLVGSEMCIRDRPPLRSQAPALSVRQHRGAWADPMSKAKGACSIEAAMALAPVPHWSVAL
eukprot:2810836-Alexandrium_andersonii.AAC.1